MKKLLFGLPILGILGCSNSNYLVEEPMINKNTESNETIKNDRPLYGISKTIPNFMSVAPELFKELYDTNKVTVIDLRTPEEIASGKIFEEALEIDFYSNDFEEKITRLDKDKPYLIYCRSGARSGKTLQLFDTLGFKEVYDLSGGKNKWDQVLAEKKEAILPTGSERIIEIDAQMYEFGTTEIHVKKDEKVLLKINNLDTTHGIRIPSLGQSDNNEILLDTSKKGIFPFSCNNLCGVGHLEMQGQIIIE